MKVLPRFKEIKWRRSSISYMISSLFFRFIYFCYRDLQVANMYKTKYSSLMMVEIERGLTTSSLSSRNILKRDCYILFVWPDPGMNLLWLTFTDERTSAAFGPAMTCAHQKALSFPAALALPFPSCRRPSARRRPRGVSAVMACPSKNA